MEQSQIIRLPKKYGELFSTLSNEEAGKLIKEIFGFDSGVEGLTRVYRDIMNVDIYNMESSAMNGGKGGRPKKPQDKTPGYKKGKPQDIENDNLKEEKVIEDKRKEDKNREIIKLKIDKLQEGTSRYDFFFFLYNHKYIQEEYTEEELENIDDKLKEFLTRLGKDRAMLEIESFIEHHKKAKTVFKGTIGRLNTWLSNKLK